MDRINYTKTVDKYANTIYRIALNYCKNKYDAEDILQNVFLKLLQSDVSFESEEHLKHWLIRVTINICKDFTSSFWEKHMVSTEESLKTMSCDFTTDEKSDLYELVMKLPQKYRVAIYLYYYEDYSVKEIAEILQIKETTVQTRLMRARKKLEISIKEDGHYEW